jgi:DNA-directed RNA polymerase specialized sigma24 family protein
MKTNLSENHSVFGQYNVQPFSYSEEEEKITVDNFKVDNLSPDESFKRRLDFEREAMPHIKILFNYALKISGNRFDADALLRDTYDKAFRFFHKFEEGTNCKVWLGRIMRNCFINKYRNDKEKQQQLLSYKT